MRLLIFFFIVFFCKQGSGTTYRCNTSASCGCAISSTVLTRIVGGETAVQGSWSWTISLRYYGSLICGGSILSSLFIITAAHCIEDITDLTSITILAGSLTLEPSSSNKFYQIRSIAQIYEHPNYSNDTFTNDLALLRLSTPLNMTDGNIKPICLPTGTAAQPPDNIDMIAVGWGVTSMSSDTASSTLRQVTVQSIAKTSNDCLAVIYDSQLQFCAGIPAGGKDTCQGDSGGPLMAFVNSLWQLDGITSYGNGCALPGYPGVYTRVSYYISWIKSIMQSFVITTTATTTKKPTTTTTTKISVTTTNITTRPSNSATHSTVQSLFVIFFLPIITSAYSFLLLFFL